MRLSACSEQHKFCSVGFGEDLRRIVGFFFVGDSRPAEDVPRLPTEENNSTGEPMFAACQRTNGFLVNLNQHRDREVEDCRSRSFMSPSNIDITLIKEGNHEEPGWTRFSVPLVCCSSGYIWGGASDETENLCHSRCGMKKCHFLLKD